MVAPLPEALLRLLSVSTMTQLLPANPGVDVKIQPGLVPPLALVPELKLAATFICAGVMPQIVPEISAGLAP